MAEFSLTRKADRKALRLAIEALAKEFEDVVSLTVEQLQPQDDIEARLRLRTTQGLECGININKPYSGGSKDVIVFPWCVWNSDAKLSSVFPGNVNPHHRRKSTTVQYGFDEIVGHVHDVLEGARTGEIFE